jgi:O-antigen ligase
MPEHIRSLIVILLIASFIFFFAKKALGTTLTNEEFSRWRNAWFSITLIAFLSSNFWIFIALSFILIYYLARTEENKFAFYFVLLITIPTISDRLPGSIELNYVRILALAIFLPFFLKFKSSQDVPSMGKPIAEKFMIAYLLLSTLLTLRGTTFTEMLRYGLYGFTDIFLPYYCASRAIKDFNQLKKVMIGFALACLIAGAIGTFEFSKSWLLYNPLAHALNIDWDMGRYLTRDNNIRAISSLGHSIIFGFTMMVGLGFYLFVAPNIKSKTMRFTGFAIIISGLILSLSRGPWLGTAVLLLIFIGLGQKVIPRYLILTISLIIGLTILPSIPGGNRIINMLPFIGETDKSNIEYRQELFDKSILIIERNPSFGVYNPKMEPEMEDMVQGEGIIDLVNTYLIVTLYNGLVALSLLFSFYSLVLITGFRNLRKIADKKSEEYRCGRILLASLAGVLFTIATVSSIGVIPIINWTLAGLIMSYSRITNSKSNDKNDNTVVEKQIYPTSRLKITQ